MQTIESAFQNNVLAIPWMLDAVDEDLDLEIHGCGCGCSCGCGCGCGCGCSCSCSCSCDDTGANGDDDDDSSAAGDDGGGDEGFGPSAADIGQCATDITTSALLDGILATGIAAVVSTVPGGAAVAPAIMAAGTLHGAVEGAQDSEACAQVVEDTGAAIAQVAQDTGAAIAQVAQDTGAAIAEAYNQLTNDENFQKAVETVLVVH